MTLRVCQAKSDAGPRGCNGNGPPAYRRFAREHGSAPLLFQGSLDQAFTRGNRAGADARPQFPKRRVGLVCAENRPGFGKARPGIGMIAGRQNTAWRSGPERGAHSGNPVPCGRQRCRWELPPPGHTGRFTDRRAGGTAFANGPCAHQAAGWAGLCRPEGSVAADRAREGGWVLPRLTG